MDSNIQDHRGNALELRSYLLDAEERPWVYNRIVSLIQMQESSIRTLEKAVSLLHGRNDAANIQENDVMLQYRGTGYSQGGPSDEDRCRDLEVLDSIIGRSQRVQVRCLLIAARLQHLAQGQNREQDTKHDQ